MKFTSFSLAVALMVAPISTVQVDGSLESQSLAELTEGLEVDRGMPPEIQKLKQDMYQQQRYVDGLEKKLGESSDYIEDLQGSLREHQEALQTYEADCNATVSALETELEETNSELDQANSELQDANSQLSEVKSELQDASSQLSDVQSQLEEANSKLTQAQSQLEQTNTELEQANSELSQTKSELEEANGEQEGVQEEVEECEGLVDELSSSKVQLIGTTYSTCNGTYDKSLQTSEQFNGYPLWDRTSSYKYFAMTYNTQDNLYLIPDQTVEQCEAICDADDQCLAFEYGMPYGGKQLNFKPGDCQPQSSTARIVYTGHGKDINLDLYVKNDEPRFAFKNSDGKWCITSGSYKSEFISAGSGYKGSFICSTNTPESFESTTWSGDDVYIQKAPQK